MNDIASKYDPKSVEDKWYKYWLEHKLFESKPDQRPSHTIVIPPPNVTGVLHMGHMLNNTIQDLLIRRARMRGMNALWVPGTDHASIATEAKVVQKLRNEGIKKSDLGRDEFLKHAWEWTHKHGGIILEQLKKLGASCDWSRTRFTMDEKYYDSVIDCFIDLHKKGKIYRGSRMINWDPAALTALSDEEVIYKEVASKLYHVRYPIEGTNEYITIATTRPETILGDTAVCVNPNDARYKSIVGKFVTIPFVNRRVPIIADEYVDMEFGTGCLKVTPAHDINDYMLGEKFALEVIDCMNDNGTISNVGGNYAGQDRFVVREKIAEDLKNIGLLVKVEDITNKVGYSERSNAVVEPRISLQWFLSMKELSKPALDHVMNDDIRFYPPKFKNSYRHWMENIKDWCISRQLWWGHRIPAYYAPDGSYAVAKSPEEALQIFAAKGAHVTHDQIRQDEDVLDTWFSSWLWPISVFDGFYTEDEVKYYYPTADLVTAPEIMFFWVARMIVAGYEYRGNLPFKNVYYTGIVRDKQGRKMSKSLGNSPDPLDLISQFGADGVRVGMLLCSPAGNDLLFDESLCEQGRNFTNKLWNAFRLIKGWSDNCDAPAEMSIAQRNASSWMRAKMNQALNELNDDYDKFRINEALMRTYKLVWDDFCAWYLEMMKPPYGTKLSKAATEESIAILEDLLKLLHPFMPFITEEIWQHTKSRKQPSESICLAAWPETSTIDASLLSQFEEFSESVIQIRNIRKNNQISMKESLSLIVSGARNTTFDDSLKQLCGISEIIFSDEKPRESFTFRVGNADFFIPFTASVDVAGELEKLQAELEYHSGFLQSVEKKLSNEKFVNNAPANVLEIERKKQSDAQSKIQAIQEKITALKN
jgi:valyl-tRNA synthetase